jgi:hypothetical protein
VIFLCAAAFREMHYLIPQVHPFDDHRYDFILRDLDRRWFGDVDAFFLAWPGAIVDLLHLCYWFYFVGFLILGGALHARKQWQGLREYLAVILTGLFVSYLGYFLVPAIGPHHFFHPRPPSSTACSWAPSFTRRSSRRSGACPTRSRAAMRSCR